MGKQPLCHERDRDSSPQPLAARGDAHDYECVLAMTETQRVLGSVVRKGRISQEEYALLVGATRQSVNQQFRRWERAGWIRIGYGGVEVVDREALRDEIAR